jgi:SpoVK/Ycf46/Vps4 family AAA+-type ATPase
LISYKSLTEKKLYFPEDLRQQIGALGDVMRPNMFRSYRKALLRNKLSSGITAVFFGEPGTGKTEAVYQLARKTGRDIMMVDLSETKSKWFGESEKIVKKIFDNYSALLKNSDVEPILFINEADGLFTKRIDLNAGRGNSSEQAINTIQNILLQALENFEGILLATTNLTKNLDKAFERRFTFKIDFPKPDRIVRKDIWLSKLPELSESEAASLSAKFEITGGEIDVQVRQVILKRILNKKLSLFDAVYECCSKDHGFSGKKRVGF